jgi:hypothetical protein
MIIRKIQIVIADNYAHENEITATCPTVTTPQYTRVYILAIKDTTGWPKIIRRY